jgi:hypothetical protein
MPSSDAEIKLMQEQKRQKIVTIVEFLVQHPDEWFTEEELQDRFMMWKCTQVLLRDINDYHYKMVDSVIKTITKMTDYTMIPNEEKCESVILWTINKDYLKKRLAYESAGTLGRWWLGKVFPYGGDK